MLRLVALAIFMLAVSACGRAPAGSPFGRADNDQTPMPEATALPPRSSAPVEPRQADASWTVDVMEDPDPRVRRFALEQWARNPTESLDLVAAAMVDPEESIRERAEQVFEDALTRRK